MFVLTLVAFLCVSCSRERSGPTRGQTVRAPIQFGEFGVLESELTPAILVHSESKYLGLFADAVGPSHIALSTRSGPRPFRRGERLKADEMEEGWLLLWGKDVPPWVVYLQHRPLALTLDTNGLQLSFANGAGDVALLPLHGSSTNIDTAKWSEFLPREPLMRVRYWASLLREFPVACEITVVSSNTVQQRFQFHSIRDDWRTRPLTLAPMSPPLAAIADEKLKRTLMDLEMPTPFGPYLGLEGASEWKARFATIRTKTNCAWASFGDCKIAQPNTSLIQPVSSEGWPRISGFAIKNSRDQQQKQFTGKLLNPHSRVITAQE